MSDGYRSKIFFSTQDQDLVLEWRVLDHLAAALWVKNLRLCLQKNFPFYARYSGFLKSEKTMESMSRKLNRIIELINSEGIYHIKERSPLHFDQEFSNIIHHHFELLLGSIENFSEYYHKSSHIIRAAIPVLNHLIHDMETASREKESEGNTFAAICCEMPEAPRFRMPKEFYHLFEKNIDFGDMVTHYGMVGKTWWEVYLDRDEDIFAEAIRPLNIVSGEFDLFFGRHQWSKETTHDFNEFLKKHGQDPDNPELGIGYLPLAKLIREKNWDDQKYKEEISKSQGLKRMELWRDDQLIEARDFIIHDGFLSFEDIECSDELTFHLTVPSHVFNLKLVNPKTKKIKVYLPQSTASNVFTMAFKLDVDYEAECIVELVYQGLEFTIHNRHYQQVLMESRLNQALLCPRDNDVK